MPSRLANITRNLLTLRFYPSDDSQAIIRNDILSSSRYFVVAKPGTNKEDWEKRTFAAYISDQKELLLFLSMDDAVVFARRNGIIAPDDQPMVMKAGKQAITNIVMEYYDSGLITNVKVYAIPPLCMVVPVPVFVGVAKKEAEEPVDTKTKPQGYAVPKKQQFLEVEKIKGILDTYDNAARRKLDPAGRFENVHQLIETLLMRNGIEPSVLDTELGFAPGFTQNFCQDIVASDASKETVQLLLNYFGMGEYLYLYKGYSRDLLDEIKNNPTIDIYSLKNARPATKEVFELKKIQRGQDETNGAYVYGLTLKSEFRTVRIVLSSPYGYTVGKSYEIEGLEPIAEQNNVQGVTKAHEVRDLDDSPDNVEDKIIRPSKPGHQLRGTPDEQKERQDFILGHFKKADGINYAAAVEKYKVLVEDPDVLEAYYKFLKEHKHGFLARQGFTPQQLVQEYKYPAYEAYCIMIQLAENPSETKTMLAHRKNEPQYQKDPPQQQQQQHSNKNRNNRQNRQNGQKKS